MNEVELESELVLYWGSGVEGHSILSLTVFFASGIPSAEPPDDPVCVTATSPGAFSSAARGPAGPARPVTALFNHRSLS